MNKGYLSIVLHAHLPYVHHPEYDNFFEECWLFEAITECYMPLIAMLDRLQADGVDYRLTLSLSPTLLTLWRSPLLQSRYLIYLQRQLALAEQEVVRTRQQQPAYLALAEWYRQFFREMLNSYRDHYQCDLLAAILKHQQTGKLELITTAATHGYLPLLNINEAAVRRQIKIGIDTFTRMTGLQPMGFWLPECGYYPGLENSLHDAGIQYFFLETHGILDANPAPKYGVYAPLACANGVVAFGRDPASSRQVWSAEVGYPGDGDYREYYRDIGQELPLDYLGPYLPDAQARSNTGIKYYRVTGGDQPKQLYQRSEALAKVRLHAEDFIAQRQLQIDALSAEMTLPPLIIAPYDAELFGHWWFEGPHWLEAVLRLAADDSNAVQTITGSEYLALGLTRQIAAPAASSWGQDGYSSYWLNENNDWIYPLIHKAETELEKLTADIHGKAVNQLQRRALNQAVRSLLLAQASDWPFILKSGTTVEYAKQRIIDHLARFNYLHDAIRKNRINERYLAALEIMDDVFPDVDFQALAAFTG